MKSEVHVVHSGTGLKKFFLSERNGGTVCPAGQDIFRKGKIRSLMTDSATVLSYNKNAHRPSGVTANGAHFRFFFCTKHPSSNKLIRISLQFCNTVTATIGKWLNVYRIQTQKAKIAFLNSFSGCRNVVTNANYCFFMNIILIHKHTGPAASNSSA